MDKLEEAKLSGVKAANEAQDLQQLDAIRVNFLGKKGQFASFMAELGKLSNEERPQRGAVINEAKQAVVAAIEERRAMVLNEKGMLHYTKKNTESIKERYSASLVIAYLLKHKRDWLKQPKDVAYDTDIAIGLIKSSLTISEKTVLISCFDADIVNSELADEIIRILSRQEIKLDVNFLLKVMKLTNLMGERLKVLNYTLEKNAFDENLITAFIETLHFPYKCIAEKGKKPEIPSDEESWRLVKLLKDNDYISSYSETKKGIRVNTKLK